MKHQDHPLKGAAYLVASLACMAILAALVKAVSAREPISEVLFFRFAGSLIPLLWILKSAGGITLLRTQQPLQHFLRTLFGILGIGSYFVALAEIPMAEATAIIYSAPLFVFAFSVVLLPERIDLSRALTVGVGFIGVLLIVRPGHLGLSLGSVAAITSAIFGALVSVWIRRLSRSDHVVCIALFYNGFGALAMLLWLLARGWEFTPGPDFIIMLAIGLIAGIQQYLMTAAFRLAEATFLAPLEYIALVFAGLTGWLFWSEVPDTWSVAGAAVICISGIVLARLGSR